MEEGLDFVELSFELSELELYHHYIVSENSTTTTESHNSLPPRLCSPHLHFYITPFKFTTMGLSLGQTLRSTGYSRRELGMRGALRKDMKDTLVLLSGDPDAQMHWTQEGYYKHVYEKYGLKLVGFPQRWKLANLSDITGSARIGHLVALWEDGQMRFERVSEEERRAAAIDRLLAAVGCTDDDDDDDDGSLNGGSSGNGNAGHVRKKTPVRPDCGAQRERPVRNPHGLNRKMPKSALIITPEMEAEAEEEEDSVSSISEFSDEEERRAQRRAELMPSDPIESEWSD